MIYHYKARWHSYNTKASSFIAVHPHAFCVSLPQKSQIITIRKLICSASVAAFLWILEDMKLQYMPRIPARRTCTGMLASYSSPYLVSLS